MLLELKFSVYTLGLAMGTFLAGLYGMNLENFIEESNFGFAAVTIGSAVASILVAWWGFTKLRRVQRVRMRESTRTATSTRKLLDSRDGKDVLGYGAREWYREESPTALLEAKHRERLKRIAQMKEKRTPVTGFKKWIQWLK